MSKGIWGTWLGHPRNCAWVALGALMSLNAQAQERHCASLLSDGRQLGAPNTPSESAGFRQAPNFVVLSNAGALAETACTSTKWASIAFEDTAERMRAALGMDPQILVVLTTAPLSCADIFYLPYANDIRGIGYQHYDPRDVFDDTPESRLEGIAFLNDIPYWQAHPEEFAKDFKHEIGHRWAARVYATQSGVPSSALLGRQLQHWSYFLDTGGSPLEGNAWTTLESHTFSATAPLSAAEFSDFDLYLMGVLPPNEVRSETLVVTEDTPLDCVQHSVQAASPPQTCGPLQVSGTSQVFDIKTIIDAEGERSPATDTAVRTLDIAVLVLEQDNAPMSAEACQLIALGLKENIDAFGRSALERIILRNVSESSTTCDEAAAAPVSPTVESHTGCAIEPRSTRAQSGLSLLVLMMLRLCRRRVYVAARK